MEAGTVIYQLSGGDIGVYSQIQSGEQVIVLGVVGNSGTIKKHRENLGVKP